MRIEGLDKLKLLVGRVEQRNKYLRNKAGQEVNLNHTQVFTRGPFLHQDQRGENGLISGEESAAFERDHPEIFRFIQSIKDDVFRMLESE